MILLKLFSPLRRVATVDSGAPGLNVPAQPLTKSNLHPTKWKRLPIEHISKIDTSAICQQEIFGYLRYFISRHNSLSRKQYEESPRSRFRDGVRLLGLACQEPNRC